MIKFIIWSIILTVILRFVLRFVLPIFQVTRVAQEKMRQMQQQMEEMQQKNNVPPRAKPTQVDGDYIEYEEVK